MSSRPTLPLVILASLALSACGGSSSPPPPAGSPSPEPQGEGLRPLSSREGGPGAAAPTDTGSEGLPPGHPPVGGESRDPNAVAPSGASISGSVVVADALASRLAPGDVLYVMAKKDGTTLAAQRVGSPTFPASFVVSEGHAMVAGTSLEGPVDIVARLSKTGDAIPSAGDLEGTTRGVAVPSQGITVTIDQVLQ